MRPETLPLISEFKKDYKFLWLITADDSGASGTYSKRIEDLNGYHYEFPELSEGTTLYNSVVANPLFSGYVSQLAESVTLPDDEFETETIPQGPVEYEMPKKVKLANINVTYLEDSLETVYNFHKAWFQAIRCGKGIGINSPSLFSATARYIPFEDTMLATEYALLKNEISQRVNAFISSNYAIPSLPPAAKASSITTYPKIYPKQIHRSTANHAGKDISTVEVTYARIPVFEKKHTALQMWDGSSWNNTDTNYEF